MIDAIYYCPHHPEGLVETYRQACDCRKPSPGMLLKAAHDFGLDLHRCYLVGDKAIDIETIHRVGGKGILIRSAVHPVVSADHTAADLREAVSWIIRDAGV